MDANAGTSSMARSAASCMAKPAARRAVAPVDSRSADPGMDGTAGSTAWTMARTSTTFGTVAGNMERVECGSTSSSSSQLGRRFLLRLSRNDSLAGKRTSSARPGPD